jgi:hypothetical protein
VLRTVLIWACLLCNTVLAWNAALRGDARLLGFYVFLGAVCAVGVVLEMVRE